MKHLQTYWNLFIGRSNDFAQQHQDGGYFRVGRALSMTDLAQHLDGRQTLGSYLINERGRCRCAVFDADNPNGLQVLRQVQTTLTHQAIPAYLERSRRGGHLWVFFAEPVPASQVRAWLLPSCPSGVEFYPKQVEGAGYGSLIRLPLGVHLRSGKRYPFVEWHERGPVAVARSVQETLAWLTSIQRVHVPTLPEARARAPRTQETSFSNFRQTSISTLPQTIRSWCATQNPYQVITRYVDLNSQGVGACPFRWHHAGGQDAHASFKVYTPGTPGGYCWYCYTWQRGGSVFDFLRYWHAIEPREMWKRIQRGEIHP
ncbi:MAG TPA: hypothetical protein VGD98_09850 [Ktedonobacteraceae bacterium]